MMRDKAQLLIRKAARATILSMGAVDAGRLADAEIERSVLDVTYPMGRIALYRAIRDMLDADARDARTREFARTMCMPDADW